MESTKRASTAATAASWREAGLRYHAYSHFLRERFGGPVRKVSLDGGFTCPNVDGTVAVGGCVFCDNRSFSPSRRVRRTEILRQLELGITKLGVRFDAQRFLAYFQPGTNTYAPVERLRDLYEAALEHPQVVGLAIGTRPDCLPDDVLELLTELAQRTYLSLELGLQTMHDRSLVSMNRGHGHAALVDAVERCRDRGFDLGAHVILGLPGESADDMRATAEETARLGFDSVKLHNLYVVEGTPLAEWHGAGQVVLFTREEYVSAVVDFLERLPASCVIERLSGEAPPQYFIAPQWSLDKAGLRAAIERELQARDTWQGKLCPQDQDPDLQGTGAG